VRERRRLALGLALLALVAGAPARAAAEPCEVVHEAPLPASASGELVLPVVVHYMKSSEAAHDEHDVEDVFPRERLERYFRRTGTINRIWAQAGITLVLHRLERCLYRPADYPGAGPEERIDPFGAPGLRNFLAVVERYNFRPARGVDLYFWWAIKGYEGYSRPYTLSDGTRTTGAVWVDRRCVTRAAAACPRLIAHEIGHFLGLCHVCRLPGEARTGCTACVGPWDRLPLCGAAAAPRARLMRSDFNGHTLDACETARAGAQARERVQGAP